MPGSGNACGSAEDCTTPPNACQLAEGAVCNEGVCEYPDVVCDSPEADRCIEDGAILVRSSLPGTCDPQSGACTYAEEEIAHPVLTRLEEDVDDVARQVRELMFTWDDLATIEKRAMQKILASIDTKTLSIALKASSDAVMANVMGNLSSRVRDMVIDEKELLGPMPFSDVLQSRAEIMAAVRSLMDSGEFSPARAGEELVT